MSQTYVSKELRQRVAAQARHRCGYCLTVEAIVGSACSLCNDHKSSRIAAVDSETGEIIRLFDPRRQTWGEHFRWSDDGCEIIGQTATGRATVAALHLNRPSLIEARRLWVLVGWHPPKD